MINVEISGQAEHLLLELRGEMGIQQAVELHQALLRALEQAQWLEVDLSAAREVGLPCLQFLCSAHRSARKQGKRMSLAVGVSQAFKEAVARAGFPRQSGCGGETDKECLWKTEGAR